MYLTYEDARARIEKAPHGDWHLPAYKGGTDDLGYLKNWVAANAAKMYGVSVHVFDHATVYSTTLLRDFVHRAVYENPDSGYYKNHPEYPSFTKDVAGALRYPASDSCGLMGYQLWRVYQSLGFDTTRFGGIDGEYLSSKSQWTYKNGHVLTEVYLEDLGKYALQDATFNTLFTDNSGTPLSHSELRAAHFGGDGFNIEQTEVYLRYREWGYTLSELHGNYAYYRNFVTDSLNSGWDKVSYAFQTSAGNFTLEQMRPGATTLSRQDAINKITDAQTMSVTWELAISSLRANGALGFKTISPTTGQVTGEFITIKLADGTFVTRDAISGKVYNGSYDQLVNEATHTGQALNPGKDLSIFLQPVALMTTSGVVGYELEIHNFANAPTIVNGTTGADALHGNAGVQTLIGLGGNDLYYIDNQFDRVVEAANGGNDRVFTSVSYTLAAGTAIEYLSAADAKSHQAINLTGNEFKNILAGNDGDNLLNGGAGADNMFGRGGDDTYFVDNRGDAVNETAGNGYDRIYTSVSYSLTSASEVEFLAAMSSTGKDPINLYGNQLANTLIGNAGANILDGKAGIDTMKGLGGDDSYVVDNVQDKVIEAAGGGTDYVFASVSYRLAAGTEVEVLRATGTANINLTGNEFANTVIGNSGNNVIIGGLGNDLLIGGAGSDTFMFNTALDGAKNVDKIHDFDVTQDHIRLDDAIFSMFAPGALDSSAFHIGKSATTLDQHIIYDDTTGALYYDANGSAAGGQVQFATLATGLHLNAGHFWIV